MFDILNACAALVQRLFTVNINDKYGLIMPESEEDVPTPSETALISQPSGQTKTSQVFLPYKCD